VDALAQLAMMTKAKAIFESDDTFLSFPALSPLSYSAEQLAFVVPGDLTPQRLNDASEFAHVANQIPRGVLAPVAQGEYLWEVYRDVLATAQPASGALTTDEQAQLDAARAVLSADVLTAYRQYRDATYAAEEEYKNQQLTAENSDDAALKAKWTNDDEPRLRATVARAQADWVSLGHKNEVEAAEQVQQRFANSAPTATWNEWQTSFMDDLDIKTTTDVISFAPTGFSPYDIVDDNDWPEFELARSEIAGLIAQAPAELTEIFGSNLEVSAIEHISFQYRSVAVTRSWLRPALFNARFWRLPTGAEVLSDGTDAANGRCPSYIAALVFIRNVSVTLRQTAGGQVVVRDHRSMLQVNPTDLKLPASFLTAIPSPGHIPVPVGGDLHAGIPALQAIRDHRTGAAAPGLSPGARALVAPPRWRGLPVFTRPIATVSTPPPASTPQPPTATDAEVSVLAFICKRLPRCPDPDPSLSWS
jgi:hypothetical protein